jgi:hypothetical protein
VDLTSMTEAEARAALDGKVLQGKDGWLFLDNDANQVLKQHTGELRLSAAELEDWRLLLEARFSWLEKLGIPYFFVVAPNAHSVYPEKLPDRVKPVADRPIVQLIDHLRRTGSYGRLLYPIDELLEEKRRRPVYSETDSYWNFLGGFVAYTALMKDLSRSGVEARQLREKEIGFGVKVEVGGLGLKVEPNERSPHVFVRWMPKTARVVHDNCIMNQGSLMEFECDEAPPTTCLFLGDSFSRNLLLFMAESFGRLVYAYSTRLDFDLVREKRPDVVISLINERFMIKVPFDLPRKSIHQLAREKKESGKVRKRMEWWDPPTGA